MQDKELYDLELERYEQKGLLTFRERKRLLEEHDMGMSPTGYEMEATECLEDCEECMKGECKSCIQCTTKKEQLRIQKEESALDTILEDNEL